MSEQETADVELRDGWITCPKCGGCGMVLEWGGAGDCMNCYQGEVPAPDKSAESDQ